MSGDGAEGTLSKTSPTPTVIDNEEKTIYVHSPITLYQRVAHC